MPKEKVSVIPNAVDTAYFTPNPSCRPSANKQINIVIVSRLVYRKGVDLMAGVISKLATMKNVHFLIGGDGPKRTLLEEIREKRIIQDRVRLLRPIEHAKVRDILRCGHIFLNTSLTEAYCMAIVEAASCGLQVVSTRVGGIPEVLPSNLIYLTETTIESVYKGVLHAIRRILFERQQIQSDGHKHFAIENNPTPPLFHGDVKCGAGAGLGKSLAKAKRGNQCVSKQKLDRVQCPYQCNEILRNLYNWNDIAVRTEKVYRHVLHEKDPTFGDKLKCYLKTCKPFVLVVSFSYLLLRFLDFIQPRRFIDTAAGDDGFGDRTSFMHRTRKKRA